MRFVKSLDDFGHQFQLTYKGEDNYQTRLGGICSLLIKVNTLILFIVKFKSMLLMEDPIITNFDRPLSKEEKQNHKVVNFADEDFVFGVVALINDQ